MRNISYALAVFATSLAAPVAAKPVVLDCSLTEGAAKAGLANSYFIVLDELSDTVTISTAEGTAPIVGRVARSTKSGAVVEWPTYGADAVRVTARIDLSTQSVAMSPKGTMRKARGTCAVL